MKIDLIFFAVALLAASHLVFAENPADLDIGRSRDRRGKEARDFSDVEDVRDRSRSNPRDLPDEIRQRMESRSKEHRDRSRSHHDKSRPDRDRQSRTEHDKEANIKLKENARRRADKYHDRIANINDLPEEHVSALKQKVENLYSLEEELHDKRLELGQDFPDIAEIQDATERRAQLDAARERRETKREHLEVLRNKITETRQHIEDTLSSKEL